MLKLMGAVLLAGGGAFCGFGAVGEMKRREYALREMAELLTLLEQELKLGGLSLGTILQRLGEQGQGTAHRLLAQAADQLARAQRPEFSVIWTELTEQYRELGTEGRHSLGTLGDTLGRCDSESQCRAVELVRQRLDVLAARQEEKRNRQGRMCQMLGLSCGTFLAILLL